MPFQIIRNDIAKVEADAVVNTADPEAVVGGETDWAIHTAARVRRREGIDPDWCAPVQADVKKHGV